MVAEVSLTGEVLGGYRIGQPLGTGGMGVVYAAEHESSGRRAAVKVLRREMSADAEVVKRFFNEARAATRIQHPGMVAVLDFGTHPTSGCGYLVMEQLEGESLWTLLRRERMLPVDRLVDIGRQIASTLAAAHAASIVHRDLKPANLFLVDDPAMPFGWRVKVLDFGIAKLTDDNSVQSLSTVPGRLLGTPAYMAPEQCRGAECVDWRADVYALGCILFEMATGDPPFGRRGSMAEMMTAHMGKSPPPVAPLRADLPAPLAQMIDRCLRKPPEWRPQSMHEMVTTLALLAGGPLATRMPRPLDDMPAATPGGPLSVTMTASSQQLVQVPVESRRRRRWLAYAAAAVALVLAGWLLAARETSVPARAAQVPGAATLVEAAAVPDAGP